MPRLPINYNNALIYKLVCLDPNVKEIYVGSTTNFVERKKNHKNTCNNPNGEDYKQKVYQHIRAFGGWTNWKMVLIEFYACNNNLELGKREDYWKNKLKAVLNTNAPPMYETREEWREANREDIAERNKKYREANKEDILEYQRDWYEANREDIAERQKKYREANREDIAERQKKYREANREDIAEQSKKYREANKEVIAEKAKQKHNCECGGKYTHQNKSTHEKSKKHQKYLAENTNK